MKRRIATAILLLLLVVIAGCETGQMASNGENQAPPPQITTEDPMPLEPPAPAEAHEQENTAVEKAEASPRMIKLNQQPHPVKTHSICI